MSENNSNGVSSPGSPPVLSVSVAIPAYKNEGRLASTLSRIFACSPLPQEILIHLDGDWVPERDLALNAPVPVRVFKSENNVGPGGGRHRLIHEAATDLVACFDDDSWPLDAGYFARAKAVMDAFPSAAIMSPAVYLREKPEQPSLLEVSEGVSFEGSASVTRRSHYLQLPGYVPVANAYGVEEADISLQVHAAGFQLLNCPWLRAWHDRPYADYQHGLEPWIRNEVLLAYLRYPRWLQPWGWLRAVRHVSNHATAANVGRLLQALASSPAQCARFASYCRRYSLKEIINHHFAPRRRWTLEVATGEQGVCSIVQASLAPPSKRVMFVQYTNPAGYPPLQHSSQILAREGWEVHFAGIAGRKENPLEFAPFIRIRSHSMSWCAPGWRQKLHYVWFVLWTLWLARSIKPHWVYASDPFSAAPALAIRWLTKCHVVYHEHDSPVAGEQRSTRWNRVQGKHRRMLAATADAVVVPNAERLAAFVKELQPRGRSFCVWNCSSLAELPTPREARPISQPLLVLYHGSIVMDRFPASKLEALAKCGRDIRLRLIGYETSGSKGYTSFLKAEAERLGVSDRFEYLGPMHRFELMKRCGECDVGLSLLRIHDGDINMQHMTGASNKPFDYLSQGLALIVPDDPEWVHLYVDNGCAKACKVGTVDELAELFVWMDDHRYEVRVMGAAGLRLVKERWNYEAQFKPVLELMDHPDTKNSTPAA